MQYPKLKHFFIPTSKKWNFNNSIPLIATVLLGLTGSTAIFADDGGDLLSSALPQIKANFGLGSVFIKGLYLLEIYYGWRKWRETHNPWAVGGIVLVALYLTYAIGKWVGA